MFDHTLRRELKGLVRADGGLSLLDVRREAIRWVVVFTTHLVVVYIPV